MPLAVSNLAWPPELEEDMFALLPALGVTGIEVAPTRIGEWDALPSSLLAGYRSRVEAAGLVVSSLQAVLFGRPNLQLLGEGDAFDGMVEHMRLVANIGAQLGATVLVFGAPRNRLLGDMDPDRAWAMAQDRLRLLGEITFAEGMTIGIEPVPGVYGGDFLTVWEDVLKMVTDVDHPGVRVHLDTGCVALGGGSIETAIAESRNVLAHFHAAQPQLGSFADPLPNHTAAGKALRDIGYDRWISIEMRQQDPSPIVAVEQAVVTTRAFYGI